jgi:malonate-semialdehyde dehydrogenase (acetylating)/methylmalonate-semialdehyde dehydrogenase
MSTAVLPNIESTAIGATRAIPHWIDGKAVAGNPARSGNVYNPATGQVQALVPLAGRAELDLAVAAAEAAFPAWSAQPPLRRARVLFRFRELFEQHLDDFAQLITAEHGKVFSNPAEG